MPCWKWNKHRDSEIKEELDYHLAMVARERMEDGDNRSDATSSARRKLGNKTLITEITREMWTWGWLERIAQDLRYAWRMMLHSPGFAAIAVLTLALGIGANTAVFSVVNGVLLNPLPFPHPNQLLTFYQNRPNFPQGSLSYLNFLDWKSGNHTFASMAAYRQASFVLMGAGTPESVSAEKVTADFFNIVGTKPVIGRTFSSGEDRPGSRPVALIGAGLWSRKFGSAKDILNRPITLEGRAYSIVGVIPADFHLNIQNFNDHRDVYVLLEQSSEPSLWDRKAMTGMDGIGRLRPDVKVEQARVDLETIARNLARAYPEANGGTSATVVELKQETVGDIQPFLVMLLVAVAFVLLIACVNIANLLLARANGRSREFAIRGALGAGQWRVIRQLLTESVLLGAAGGGLGLLFATWGTKAALKRLPEALPRAENIGIDGHVLWFTIAVSLLAGILFGLAPAIRTGQADLNEALKEGGRGGSGTKRRAQEVFVMAEVAIALVLLAGAGLMIRSLALAWRIDPGFDPHNVLLSEIVLSSSTAKANPASVRAGLRQVVEKVKALPGVTAASFFDGAIPMEGDSEQLFWLGGQPKPASHREMNWSLHYLVMPDYFKALRIQIERGRLFTANDNEHSRLVAIIDEVFARKFFPNEHAVGKILNLADEDQDRPVQIVGVVGHVKHWGLDTDNLNTLRAELYVPLLQQSDKDVQGMVHGLSFVVRTTATGPAITRAILEAHKEAVVDDIRTMDQIVARTLAARQFSMILLGAFAALALLLASIGLYGVVSYAVGQRTQEIGIRMALGARRQDVFRGVLLDGLRMVSLGAIVGVAGSLYATNLMSSMLIGVNPADPLTFLAVGFGLLIVSLAACYLPARRAMCVDPMVALRYE
ncbi:MAG: ABC transporter permease [Bryobacteraceae bacterium]